MELYKGVQQPLGWGMDRVRNWFPESLAMRLFNIKNLGKLALASQVVVGLEVEKRAFDVFQYIDPLIGTSEGGEC